MGKKNKKYGKLFFLILLSPSLLHGQRILPELFLKKFFLENFRAHPLPLKSYFFSNQQLYFLTKKKLSEKKRLKKISINLFSKRKIEKKFDLHPRDQYIPIFWQSSLGGVKFFFLEFLFFVALSSHCIYTLTLLTFCINKHFKDRHVGFLFRHVTVLKIGQAQMTGAGRLHFLYFFYILFFVLSLPAYGTPLTRIRTKHTTTGGTGTSPALAFYIRSVCVGNTDGWEKIYLFFRRLKKKLLRRLIKCGGTNQSWKIKFRFLTKISIFD